MLSVWHLLSQEELKFARPAVVLMSRAGVGMPRTEGERERRRRRMRGMEMGFMIFFFFLFSFFSFFLFFFWLVWLWWCSRRRESKVAAYVMFVAEGEGGHETCSEGIWKGKDEKKFRPPRDKKYNRGEGIEQEI